MEHMYVEETTVEHLELSFNKRLDTFNVQAYGLFTTNIKNEKLPCTLSNKAKKRQLHRDAAQNHIFMKPLAYYNCDLRMIAVHISYGCS